MMLLAVNKTFKLFSSTIKRLLIFNYWDILLILSINCYEEEIVPLDEIRNLKYIFWDISNCNAAIRTDDPSGRTNKLIA